MAFAVIRMLTAGALQDRPFRFKYN